MFIDCFFDFSFNFPEDFTTSDTSETGIQFWNPEGSVKIPKDSTKLRQEQETRQQRTQDM